MKLYFVRHTAVDVPAGVCYGQTDVALKSSFDTEAHAVLQQIKSIAFDGVFTSPLSRCLKLARYCGFDEAIIDPRLQELNFGAWEMRHWDEINDPNLLYWYNNYLTAKTTAGESFIDLYQRFCDFMDQLPKTLTQVIIFTHGGIINCARVYAKTTTLETMFHDTPSYGSITPLTLFDE